MGKIGEHTAAVLGLVSYCFDTLAVDRLVYIGGDDGIERALGTGGAQAGTPVFDLSSAGFWRRTLGCVDANPTALSTFVSAEQRLLSLLRLETVTHDEPLNPAASIADWGLYHVRAQLTPGSSKSLPPGELVVFGADHHAFLPEESDHLRFAPGSLSEAGLLVLSLSSEPNHLVDAQLLDREGQCQRRSRLHLGV